MAPILLRSIVDKHNHKTELMIIK